jgi:hypothetical protein
MTPKLARDLSEFDKLVRATCWAHSPGKLQKASYSRRLVEFQRATLAPQLRKIGCALAVGWKPDQGALQEQQ